jgi:hypothetical protein
MKAIKATGTIDDQGRLSLDTPLDVDQQSHVEVIVLIPEVEEIDEDDEPKESILSGLRQSLKEVREGKTIPLEKLWDGVDV